MGRLKSDFHTARDRELAARARELEPHGTRRVDDEVHDIIKTHRRRVHAVDGVEAIVDLDVRARARRAVGADLGHVQALGRVAHVFFQYQAQRFLQRHVDGVQRGPWSLLLGNEGSSARNDAREPQ